MRRFTAAEARQNFASLLEAADEIAEITVHGRRRYVVMPAWAFDAYEELRRVNNRRRVVVSVETALARFAQSDDRAGLAVLREHNALARRLIDRGEI